MDTVLQGYKLTLRNNLIFISRDHFVSLTISNIYATFDRISPMNCVHSPRNVDTDIQGTDILIYMHAILF